MLGAQIAGQYLARRQSLHDEIRCQGKDDHDDVCHRCDDRRSQRGLDSD